jgi:hypothetical protein
VAHEQREAMGSTTTKTARREPGPEHRWAVVVVAAIGVGLVVAPFAFGMFSKAPKGAVMIDEFAPYMTTARLNGYQRELSEINAGVRQTDTSVAAYLNAAGADPRGFDAAHPGFASFDAQWPAIDSKMTGLMDQVQDNLGNYQAVAALPSFKLFPWFFVIPGVLIAASPSSYWCGRPAGAAGAGSSWFSASGWSPLRPCSRCSSGLRTVDA